MDSWCLWDVFVCEMLRHKGINQSFVCPSMNIGIVHWHYLLVLSLSLSLSLCTLYLLSLSLSLSLSMYAFTYLQHFRECNIVYAFYTMYDTVFTNHPDRGHYHLHASSSPF